MSPKVTAFSLTSGLVLLVALLPALSEARKCYVCNSAVSPRCADPMDKDYLTTVDCLKDCRKMVQTVPGKTPDSSSVTVIDRACSTLSTDADLGCINRLAAGQLKTVYCYCNTDGCNSGVRSGVSRILLGTVAALTVGILGFLRI